MASDTIDEVPVTSPAPTKTKWAEIVDVNKEEPIYDRISNELAGLFPYKLDGFQKQAMIKIKEGYHVLVAAHTASGKTAVAEYAIARALKNRNRVIYTSPVKALSNQKYQDFKNMFDDVGITTGDVTIDQDASCVIMTTEILAEMLCCDKKRAARHLEFVIFDEMHYISHPERGHVWEQAMIMLPKSVKIVMLSATVSNTLEFADWLGHIKKRKVYVFTTDKRPVPLRHFVFTGAGGDTTNELFEIVDTSNNFIQEAHNEATALWNKERLLNENSYEIKRGAANKTLTKEAEGKVWQNLIKLLAKKNQLPVLVFILNRGKCNDAAQQVCPMDLTTHKEKAKIKSTLQFYLRNLSVEDGRLRQVSLFRQILKHGVGVHNSAVLPVLREIVEHLYKAGLIKVLFATETFAVGVNMPARTVVFESHLRGINEGQLFSATEYTQMAGRAGRRGVDELGSVVILCKNGVPTDTELKAMILEKPEQLTSKFKLPYTLILNMLETGQSVEYLMANSFIEADLISKKEEYQQQLAILENDFDEMCGFPLPVRLEPFMEFLEAAVTFLDTLKEIMPEVFQQPRLVKLMVPGRILVISKGKYINQLGVLLDFQAASNTPCQVLMLKTIMPENEYDFPEDDLWYRMLGFTKLFVKTGTDQKNLDFVILNVEAENVVAIKNYVLNNAAEIIKDCNAEPENSAIQPNYANAVQELMIISNKLNNEEIGMRRFNFLKFLNLKDGLHLEMRNKAQEQWTDLYEKRECLDMHDFYYDFAYVYERKKIAKKRDKYRHLLSVRNLRMNREYQGRLKMLKKLRCIDNNKKVIFKGRVALCLRNKELVICQLLCRRTFDDRTPAEIIAILSAFVDTRNKNKFPSVKALQEGVHTIRQIETNVAEEEMKCRVGTGIPDKCEFGWMTPIHMWASNESFSMVKKDARASEGSVVHCVQQLNNLVMHVKDAAIALRDKNLQNKLDEAANLIKRDIVNMTSLNFKGIFRPEF